MLRASQAMRGLRQSPALRAGNEKVTSFSECGPQSTFSLRQRYTLWLKVTTDPTIADYKYEKFVKGYCADVPSYHYYGISSFSFGVAMASCFRHLFFNPDIYVRKQENKKPWPDRHRQFSYSLPYFNHRLRNISRKYRHCFIDNEPDWIDNHPLGYRPNGQATHKRCFMAFLFTIPMYRIEDPLYTSTTFKNFNKIYEDIGYSKPEVAQLLTAES